MQDKIKVVFCTDGIFPHTVGGMQRHSRLLIEELAKYRELDITVFHPHENRVFDDAYNIKEVSLEGINLNNVYLVECYKYSKRVFAALQKYTDHIIYSQGLSVWYGISSFRNRLIINPHGLEPFQGITLKEKAIGYPFRWIFRRLFNRARYVVSLGGKLTDILNKEIKGKEKKVVVLPNAVSNKVDYNSLVNRGKYEDLVNILFVGRFAFNKGINILLEVVQELNRIGYGDKLVFNLVGKGPLYDRYRSEYCFDNVNFLGFVDDSELNSLYLKNDLFVLPTLFEGMPTVVLEAMAMAMPVIVTNVGATEELVDRQNGFLIEKNNFEQLKNAILQYKALSKKERAVLGFNSFTKVNERFTWEIVGKKHYELFKDVHHN